MLGPFRTPIVRSHVWLNSPFKHVRIGDRSFKTYLVVS